MQGGSTGRLLAYDPATGETREMATGIFYANGVTLSQDEDFVLLVESGALRILRIWLKGPKVSRIALGKTSSPLQIDD